MHGNFMLPVVIVLILLVASVALIPVNDWYILARSARQQSSIDELEALFALRDHRAIAHPRPHRQAFRL
jgi:hypothetical protein